MRYDYKKEYLEKLTTAEEAVKLVDSGDTVFIGIINSCATVLADALWERRAELSDVSLISSLMMKPSLLFTGHGKNPFCIRTPFLGALERAAQKSGRPVAYTSFHLSQFDYWFQTIGRPTVAFLEVSEPDTDGYVFFGASGGGVYTYALETCDRVIFQINKQVPHVHGRDCKLHISRADAIVEASYSVPSLDEEDVDAATQKISDQIIDLVPDGATIQLGIGKLSTAIGYGLKSKNDLGIHTEMFCTPMVDLIRSGNVTNTRKGYMDGKNVFAFAMGSQELYQFIDHNEDMYCGPFSYVNDPRVIMQNNRMISINSAMAIDIYGQAAADSMGYSQYSGVGGQLDYVRGAQWSNEGKSFIATSSSFMKNGVRHSKIVFQFPQGTAVTTPRSDTQYIATEYGCVNLKELTMRDRIRAVIGLAHPDFRDGLTEQAKFYHLI